MRRKASGWWLSLLAAGWLLGSVILARAEPAPGAIPPHPQLVEPFQAPAAARILRQVALSYPPQMSPAERERDFLGKAALAKRLLGLGKVKELRQQSLALVAPGREVSWEDLRLRRWPGGDRVGVTLSVPVWVPARARKVQTYCGFERKWQTVALATPRPCGFVWFAATLSEINDKTRYRPEKLHLEVNSKFAPLAGLLLEYIFREGYYDHSRRVPLLSVRAGEDTYAASAASGPVAVECLSFPDEEGTSLAATVAQCRYTSMAEIFHGRHAPTSNHRLGLALDLNDFNFKGVVDGVPNPISRASRQYNRDAMHKLDARQMPAWVFRVAKWLGLRLPQEWIYTGMFTDWEHVDVGRNESGQ